MGEILFPQVFGVQAHAGRMEGVTPAYILGQALAINTGVLPITVGFGNALQPFASTTESWEIVSSSVNDTSAGTGARTVAVSYLDSDYEIQTAVVSLNGLTAVPVAANCFRHQSTATLTAGSGLSNAGQLTVRVSGGGASRGLVAAGACNSQQASFTVPAGHMAYFADLDLTLGKPGSTGIVATVSAFIRDAPNSLVRDAFDFTVTESGAFFTSPLGFSVAEKLTLEYRVSALSTSDSNLSIFSSGVLVDLDVIRWPMT